MKQSYDTGILNSQEIKIDFDVNPRTCLGGLKKSLWWIALFTFIYLPI